MSKKKKKKKLKEAKSLVKFNSSFSGYVRRTSFHRQLMGLPLYLLLSQCVVWNVPNSPPSKKGTVKRSIDAKDNGAVFTLYRVGAHSRLPE